MEGLLSMGPTSSSFSSTVQTCTVLFSAVLPSDDLRSSVLIRMFCIVLFFVCTVVSSITLYSTIMFSFVKFSSILSISVL